MRRRPLFDLASNALTSILSFSDLGPPSKNCFKGNAAGVLPSYSDKLIRELSSLAPNYAARS